jgi:DNA invertase Pin-like site-specific DNA recombinase
MLTLFGAVAEYERTLALERRSAGIAKAKPEGRYKGRAPVPEGKIKYALALKARGVKN